MNSLNILSARVSPPPSRSNSYSSALSLAGASPSPKSIPSEDAVEEERDEEEAQDDDSVEIKRGRQPHMDEKPALRDDIKSETMVSKPNGRFYFPKRIAAAFINSVRLVFSAIMAPGFYIIACLYDQEGRFAPSYQIKRLAGWFWRGKGGMDPLTEDALKREHASTSGHDKTTSSRRSSIVRGQKNLSSRASSSGLSSDSDSERRSSARHARSKSLKTTEEIAPSRRSIRIKLHSEDALRQRKHRHSQSSPNTQSDGSGGVSPPSLAEVTAANLKSPTSPASTLSMTRYPRAPAPPRPLIPRRMPSYTLAEPISGRTPLKTLILDLDETLIHSMAKGGRMSTGHMVEVKLNTYVSPGGVPVPGPQHPILYYVHKRPHCDDFLRRVCKWYNLVIFTASVQEYADPVIDWLETERKFFSGRYYRQHCTFRHGAFIKDLSSVEPDLSRVMILDNSPLSYMFHQDNAIPIEGWINDPTDNDLMHLVPLLEGLQHVTDVRALLALRGGEDGKHMVA